MDPPDSPNRRRSQDYRRRKADSRKILSRITYNPKKHKQRKTRELRKKLQQRESPAPPSIPHVHNTLKFGSFNVNGLDVEAAWAVEKLLKDRGFDVIIRIFSVSK